MRYLLGGYGADLGGSAEGFGVLTAGDADSPLASGPLGVADAVAGAASPSWVARHPHLDVVYATLEGQGAVQAFRRTGETTFAPLGRPVAVGAAPCHVLALPQALIVSCWGDGAVVRVALDAAGRPGAAVAWAAVDAGAEPEDTDRTRYDDALRAVRAAVGEDAAHLLPEPTEVDAVPDAGNATAQARVSRAHQAALVGPGLLATTDLGLDLVRFWRTDGEAQRVRLPAGTGPRHMVWHPSGHLYVVTEHSGEVFTLGQNPTGSWRIVGGVSLGGMPGDAAAELALSHDGEVLYAGLRGSDTIATLRVLGSGDELRTTALSEAGVSWPRHHIIARDTVLVAGQRSDEIASLALDARTGAPGRVRHRTIAPSPTAILPFPV